MVTFKTQWWGIQMRVSSNVNMTFLLSQHGSTCPGRRCFLVVQMVLLGEMEKTWSPSWSLLTFDPYIICCHWQFEIQESDFVSRTLRGLFACFDAPPHAMWSALLSFGKQRRTRDHDVEERRRSSLPLQNLYVNPAGFSRHRYARRTFWSTLVYPHVIRFSVSTFQVQQNFSDILLLLLIFSTGQLSSTPEPWCATITFWRSYSAHDEIAGMFFQSVRETTYVVVGQSLVMAFC